FKVFHDFQFADRVRESGITFVNHAIDDAVAHYKMSHDDHGTGIAVADVDGDGLYDIYFVNQVGGNELWKNLRGRRFTNITREAGVAVADRISVGAAFGDIDNDGKSGYLSQSELPLYFGLGDARTIDRVEIDWPSGTKQVVTRNLRVNQTLHV